MSSKSSGNDTAETTIHVVPADTHRGQHLDHQWPTNAAACRALQKSLAGHVDLTPPSSAIRWIAGVDVGFPTRGQQTRASIVVLDAATLEFTYSARCTTATRMPYIPGLLSFRELPAALDALTALPIIPDLLIVDGHGIAHPRGIGTATHLGLVTGLPSIGVAKRRLTGECQLPGDPGETKLLTDGQHPIGTVLKTRNRAGPVFISPGHRMDRVQALAWVRQMLAGYRLPEPTRLADTLSRDY